MNVTQSQLQAMYTSLQSELGARLPEGVMTPEVDKQLQKRLQYFAKELSKRGPLNEQEVKKYTFESIATWIRTNTIAGAPRPGPAGAAPSQPLSSSQKQGPPPSYTPTYVSRPNFNQPQQPTPTLEGEMDPNVLFAQLGLGFGSGSGIGSGPGSGMGPGMGSVSSTEASATTTPYYPLPALNRDPLPPAEATSIPQMQSPVAELQSVSTRPQTFDIAMHPAIATQPKDFLTVHPNVIKYREEEHNLIVNSFDRDWVHNMDENRYRFRVNFNGGFVAQGTGPQPTIQDRIRNIVRIEFVKALLPVEGLEVVVPRDCSSGTTPLCWSLNSTNAFVSVLSLPFIQVVLNEFEGNNIGTTDIIDKSLAICQYDATWRTDFTHVNRGYTLFFPKFMKAQRVYHPTPLANLQTMSFSILNPEGGLLSTVPDKFGIGRVVFGDSIDVSGSCYADVSTGEYLFIQTTTWFPQWAFSPLDRIQVGNYTLTTPATPGAASAFTTWLNDPVGHIVLGIVHDLSVGGTAVDGPNTCGYANGIIIRNRFVDPTTTGTCSLDYFTGPTGGSAESTFATLVATFPLANQTGAILNRSRQVQLTLRVITRELDMTTTVRADNV